MPGSPPLDPPLQHLKANAQELLTDMPKKETRGLQKELIKESGPIDELYMKMSSTEYFGQTRLISTSKSNFS